MNDKARDFRSWGDLTCPHCEAPQDIGDWFWQEPWDLDDDKTFDCTKCGNPYTVESFLPTPDFRLFHEEDE